MSDALDRLLPRYQFTERHKIAVTAPLDEVFAAVEAMDLTDSAIARGLMAVWRIPAKVVLKELPDRSMSIRDFLPLHREPPTDLVRGMIGGRADRATVKALTPEGFIAFAEPGCFKLSWGFRLTQRANDVLVETETRVFCTDRATLRVFALYWMVIRLPSGLIRRRLLAWIKRRAEARS